MNRRDVIALGVTSVFAGGPLAAFAQGKIPRIGWITAQKQASLASNLEAFNAGLAELGYADGKTINIDFRFGDNDVGRVPALVNELIALPVDLIVAQGAAAFELRKMNIQLPAVYVMSADPVAAGFAESLAKPTGNMSGLTFLAIEFNGKRLEILREIMPNLKRVAVVGNPEHPGAQLERAFTEDKARGYGLAIDYYPTATEAALTAAFESMKANPPPAFSVLADGFAVQYRQRIIDFAMSLKAPVISGWPVFAQSGALCTYGPRQTESYRRLAYYVDRVLRGTSPTDLPIERPSQFELTFNLKTANILGLTVPVNLLALADTIIE
jgi:putative tryptophan/tyrosine transport system substrate-binding protein